MIADTINSIFSAGTNRVFRNVSPENPAFSLNDPEVARKLLGDSASTAAGVSVSVNNVLGIPAVLQAVSTISGDVACMTPHVYSIDEDGEEVIDKDHEAEFLISDSPNEEMSAFELWRRFMLHALIWPDAFIFIERNGGSGHPTALFNLLPDRTKVIRSDSGKLSYQADVNGVIEHLRSDQVLHIKGLSGEVDNGLGIVSLARDAYGLAIAAAKFNSKFFANGANAGGILEIPSHFKERAKKNLEEGFSKSYAGPDNWFKTIVLREGAKFHQTMIDAEKSQLHQLREDQVREIARTFNLPPFKLGLSDSMSYNSSEMAQQVYVDTTLRHWLKEISAELSRQLLSEASRRAKASQIRFDTRDFIQVDAKTFAEIKDIERRNGVTNANKWLLKLGEAKRTDPGGDEYFNPNTTSGGGAPQESSETEEDSASEDLLIAARLVLDDAVNRLARLCCKKMSKHKNYFIRYVDSPNQDFNIQRSELAIAIT